MIINNNNNIYTEKKTSNATNEGYDKPQVTREIQEIQKCCKRQRKRLSGLLRFDAKPLLFFVHIES